MARVKIVKKAAPDGGSCSRDVCFVLTSTIALSLQLVSL